MTKYICECLDGARKCIHETPGFSAPTLCCVRAHATCHWRAVEDQEGDTPAPIIPEWCREGAWVHVTPDNREPFYGKVFAFGCSGVMITLDGKTVIGAFFMDRIKKARLRPWTYKEAIGKTVFWKFDNSKKEIASMIGRADDEDNVYVFGYGELKAKKLMMEERFSQSDGSPCGVLEHKNEQGEWVK